MLVGATLNRGPTTQRIRAYNGYKETKGELEKRLGI